MGGQADDGRGLGRPRVPFAARRAAKGAVLLAVVLAVMAAVLATPAPAQVSGFNPPDYVFEEGGTVVIDGDAKTDCRSFASFLEDGYFESGDTSAGARRVLEQCEEAGLLDSGSGTPGASASPSAASTPPGTSAANEEDEGLPETGGPALAVLLVVSGVVAAAIGLLLARKAAE